MVEGNTKYDKNLHVLHLQQNGDNSQRKVELL